MAAGEGRAGVHPRGLELDLGLVTPSVAGPKRPQDRIELKGVKANLRSAVTGTARRAGADPAKAVARLATGDVPMTDGDVVIAAITSCTNTSNPGVMMAAGWWPRRPSSGA